MPHKSTATACSAAAKSMRKKKAHAGSQWKKDGGMKKDGTPGKAGMWGARRMAIGCKGKGKGKK